MSDGNPGGAHSSPPGGIGPGARDAAGGGLVGDVACILASPDEVLTASGADRVWSAPLAGRLVEEVASGLGAGEIAVGAVPFRSEAEAHLVLPREVARHRPGADPGVPLPRPSWAAEPAAWSVAAAPPRREFERSVEQALRRLDAPAAPGAERLRKVVLARTLLLRGGAPIDPAELIAWLRTDPSVTAFAVPLPPARSGEGRVLVGATPELLVEKTGARVVSKPLAGSIRRRREAGADRAAGEALLRSDKDQREHAAVVEWIADRLAPHCHRLSVPREPSLVCTRTMWHLGTHIEGELRDPETPSLRLVADLHPTPAVCGLPGELARETIAELEPFDRGFFAGAVGWTDARGDGRWLVAIRCAELSGSTARLFAGAGIVAGSRPADEAAETSAKFLAMLRAFGIDEEGHTLPEEER